MFNAVEINSSFYRSHAAKVWERWGASVPETFRFAVKFPKEATHVRRLVDCGALIDDFARDTGALGDKRGPILLQLPPSLAFDAGVAQAFLARVRAAYEGPLALEPRHPSWFGAPDALLVEYRVGRVGADPPRAEGGGEPGGFAGLHYLRLHGSPEVYRTPYADRCAPIAATLRAAPGEAWCIFDNTMTGAATADALHVLGAVGVEPN